MAVLRQFFGLFVKIAIYANVVGTLVIFALVAIMNTDVVARGVFISPIRGVVEMVIFSLILIVFLQLPDVVRCNRLTRSDGFLQLIRSRMPAFHGLLTRGINAISAIFMFLIAWTVWPEFLESFESCHFFTQPEFGPPPTGEFLKDVTVAFSRCEYFGTPGIFTAPWWPAKLAIVFSVTLCGVLFAFKTVFGNDATGPGDLEEALS